MFREVPDTKSILVNKRDNKILLLSFPVVMRPLGKSFLTNIKFNFSKVFKIACDMVQLLSNSKKIAILSKLEC